MGKTSNVSDLRTRLEQKSEQERQQVEVLIRSELGKLRENLRNIVESRVSGRSVRFCTLRP